MAIQILRGPEQLNPLESTHTLSDGQLFYSKNNKQLYVGDGDSPISDLLPITSYLYSDPAGEESISQLSHNAVNTEGGENTLDPTQANRTIGRSSFTNGQKNRNGAYFSIVTGQNNALPRLFDQTLPDGTVVKKWRSSSSNIVGGTGNFVTSGNGVTGGNTNQNAGGGSLVVGEKNQEWTTGSSQEDGELLQTSITAYKNYSLYGANTDGYILDKDGNATTTRLSDLKFVSVISCNNIVGGLTNIGRSANSIISGKGNFVASSESFVIGSNNKLYNKTYAGPTSATASLYTYHKSNAVLGDDNQLKGRYNKILGDRNIAITDDGSSDYRQNLKIIGNDNTINSDNKIVIGNGIINPNRFITIGNGAEAIGISSDNIVYLDNARVTNAPTKDTSVIRKIDITDGTFDGSFNILKASGSNVVTNNTFDDKLKSGMSSSTLLAEVNPKFNRLTLVRKANETSLELTDALRLADICTTGSTGATYGAIDAKFASIKLKSTAGKDGNNGSTVILPDEVKSTTFTGYLNGTSLKAQQDENGRDIVGTYETITNVDLKDQEVLVEAKAYTDSKIDELDVGPITGSNKKTITSISETNGIISATYSDIVFPVTSVEGKDGDVTLDKSANYTTKDSNQNKLFTQNGAFNLYESAKAYTRDSINNLDIFSYITCYNGSFGFGILAEDAKTNTYVPISESGNPIEQAFMRLLLDGGNGLTISQLSGVTVGSTAKLTTSRTTWDAVVSNHNGNMNTTTFFIPFVK